MMFEKFDASDAVKIAMIVAPTVAQRPMPRYQWSSRSLIT